MSRVRASAVSALLVASAAPCASFVIPASSSLAGMGVARRLHSSGRALPRIMSIGNRQEERIKQDQSERPFSGVPHQLSALVAAVAAGTTALPRLTQLDHAPGYSSLAFLLKMCNQHKECSPRLSFHQFAFVHLQSCLCCRWNCRRSCQDRGSILCHGSGLCVPVALARLCL